jgi:hypothetical protein
MITKFARLDIELFTKPSKSDFLRVHQRVTSQELRSFTFYSRQQFYSLIICMESNTFKAIIAYADSYFFLPFSWGFDKDDPAVLQGGCN